MRRIRFFAVALILLISVSASSFASAAGETIDSSKYADYSLEELVSLQQALQAEIQGRLQTAAEESRKSFTSPDDFIYVDNGEEVMIRGYNGNAADIVIPDRINDLPVTRIAESAFRENSTIVSVTMPDTVTEIGDYAFYNCKSLVSVMLSPGVRQIKDYTFAFDSCLIDVGSLENISYFGKGVFLYAPLKGIIILRANSLIIDSEAFRKTKITGVKIYSDNVEIKNIYAFTELDNLQFFYVSDNTRLNINGKMMSYCPKLEAFVAPAVTLVNYSKDDLFANCTNMIIYTPASSELAAYAKAQFLRCKPDEYENMSKLYDAMEE